MEITGVVHYNSGGPLSPRPPSEFDLAHIVRSAQVQEAAGYDRVLIANAAVMPDPHVIGTHVAANTKTLKLMLAHRPGFMAPTVAARILATLDRTSNGRVGAHIIAGPSDKELQADGDFLTKEDRYHRAFEYVGIMRRLWASDDPIDHEGTYYRFSRGYAEIKPVQRPSIPIFWGGASEAAIEIGARCADVHALTGDSLAATQELLQKSAAAAARHGRGLRFISTFIVIVAETEDAAWRRADQVIEEYHDLQERKAAMASKGESNFAGRPINLMRQVSNAEQGLRQDKCLWLGMAKATQGKSGNQSTLVGTPEQVVDALMDYYDMGVGGFLLRGYRPLEDAATFGKMLFPKLRAAAAARDAAHAARRA